MLGPEPGEATHALGPTEIVRLDTVAVPLLRARRVEGYSLFRIALEVHAKAIKELPIPAETFVVDAVHSIVFNDQRFDFTAPSGIDLDVLRGALLNSLDERLKGVVAALYIEQIDFLTKAEIRGGS